MQKSGQTALAAFLLDSNGQIRTAKDGSRNIVELISSLKIVESISSPTVYAEISIFDATDFINTLIGNEYWRIDLESGGYNITYVFQCYEITARVKSEKKEAYVLKLVSPAFINNEVTNVFGSYAPTDAAAHVKKILSMVTTLGGKGGAKLDAESANKLRFTSPNWRPFDAINFIASKATRSGGTTDNPQGAYIFYENALGYHFKTIDKLIEDARDQEKPTYVYGQKALSDNPSKNNFLISKLSFPHSFNSIRNLRQGTWSGYIIGLDPSTFGESVLPTKNKKVTAQTGYYTIENTFKRMSKLEKGGKLPIDVNNPEIKKLINNPKRVHYRALPTHLWDSTKSDGSSTGSRNLNNYLDTASYNYLRKKSLEAIQLEITVPGNLNLFAGAGVNVQIPRMQVKRKKAELDKVYSGTYLIGGVTHTYRVSELLTTLHLLKDSIKVSPK